MLLFDSRTGVEVIDRRGCLELLSTDEVGRLAIIEGGQPLILPVNYAMDGEVVVFRTGPGSKLRASRGGPGCFEIDGIDRDRRSGWSVVVRGRLEGVTSTDLPLLDRVRELADPWLADRSDIVRLVPWVISGRRIRPR